MVYCYNVQAWLDDTRGTGVIIRCGHRPRMRGCFSCDAAGAEHPPCPGCREQRSGADHGDMADRLALS